MDLWNTPSLGPMGCSSTLDQQDVLLSWMHEMLLNLGSMEYSSTLNQQDVPQPWNHGILQALDQQDVPQSWIHGIVQALDPWDPLSFGAPDAQTEEKRGSVCTGISLGRRFGFHPHWDTRNGQCHCPFQTPASSQDTHPCPFPRNGRASPAQDPEEIPGTGAAGLGGGWTDLGQALVTPGRTPVPPGNHQVPTELPHWSFS